MSGYLSPLHLLVAQTLLRSPTISSTDAESIGIAVDAGVSAFKTVLAADSVTSTKLHFLWIPSGKDLRLHLRSIAGAVDDAMFTDQNVEAYIRGEAFAVLLQSVISAAMDAGINLETINTAFGSMGNSTESLMGQIPGIGPLSKAEMRYGFISGMLTLSNYRWLLESRNSLGYVGMAPPTFSRIFDVMDLMQGNTLSMQKGI